MTRLRPVVAVVLAAATLAACTTEPEATTTQPPPNATTTVQPPPTTTTQPPPSTTTATGPLGATITIEGFDFGDPVSIAAGESVVVVNRDAVAHTWTSTDGVFDSGTLTLDEEFTFTFTEPGEYAFFCTIHPTITGTLSVSG